LPCVINVYSAAGIAGIAAVVSAGIVAAVAAAAATVRGAVKYVYWYRDVSSPPHAVVAVGDGHRNSIVAAGIAAVLT